MGSCAVIEETSGGGEEMSLLLLATYSSCLYWLFLHRFCSTVPIAGVKTNSKCFILLSYDPWISYWDGCCLGRAIAHFGCCDCAFVALTYLMLGTQIQLVLLGMGFVFMMGLLTSCSPLNISWRLEEYSFASIGKVLWF